MLGTQNRQNLFAGTGKPRRSAAPWWTGIRIVERSIRYDGFFHGGNLAGRLRPDLGTDALVLGTGRVPGVLKGSETICCCWESSCCWADIWFTRWRIRSAFESANADIV